MNTIRRDSSPKLFNLFIGLLIGVSFLVCCAEAVPAAGGFLKISRKDVADQQHQNKTAQIIRRQYRQAPEDDEDYGMLIGLDEDGVEGSGEASGDGIDEGLLINPGEEELVPEITDEVGEPEETVVEPEETEENVVDPEETEETVVEPDETEETAVEPEETEETVVEPEETEETAVEPEETEETAVEPEETEETVVEPDETEETAVEPEETEETVVEPEETEETVVEPEETEETAVEPDETEETAVEPEETEETVVEPEETEETVVEPDETEETVVEPDETEETVVEPEEPLEPVEPEVTEEPITAAPEDPDAAPAYVSIHVCNKEFICEAKKQGPCSTDHILLPIIATEDGNDDDNSDQKSTKSKGLSCSHLTGFPWNGCVSAKQVNKRLMPVPPTDGHCVSKISAESENPCSGYPANYKFHPVKRSCQPVSSLTGNWLIDNCGEDQELVGIATGLGWCRCKNRRHLPFVGDNRCYHTHTKGPCKEDEWLEPHGSGRHQLQCRPCPCPGKADGRHYYWDGSLFGKAGCYRSFTEGPCPKGSTFVVDDYLRGIARCHQYWPLSNPL